MSSVASAAVIGQGVGSFAAGNPYAQGRGHGQSRGSSAHQSLGVDVVELSADAPRPLEAPLVAAAEETARDLIRGGEPSPAQREALREDRIFAAVTALLAVGMNEGMPPAWPGGLPAPTAAEMEVAYRRLTQRLMRLDEVRDSGRVTEVRLQAVEALRHEDMAVVAGRLAEAGEMAPA